MRHRLLEVRSLHRKIAHPPQVRDAEAEIIGAEPNNSRLRLHVDVFRRVQILIWSLLPVS